MEMVKKHYPIREIAYAGVNADSEMSRHLLWQLQQNVFDAKRALMRKMFEDGYVPVDDGFDTTIEVEVKCYVKRRAIDGEATDGEWISLPVSMNHFTTYEREPYATLR